MEINTEENNRLIAEFMGLILHAFQIVINGLEAKNTRLG